MTGPELADLVSTILDDIYNTTVDATDIATELRYIADRLDKEGINMERTE